MSPSLRLCLCMLACMSTAALAKPDHAGIQGFSLADVQLEASSEFAANHEQNNKYLLVLDPDNLLFNFRTTAGLPAPGESYGGWERSDVEVRGQFIGHYLSATAFAALSTGRSEFFDRGQLMVRELAKVQEAFGNGYLSAYPETFFDRLEALQPVWAPYYVIHKLMAGLLDQHELAGTEGALPVAEGMAAYFCGRVQRVIEANGTDYWHQVLDNEFGGMNEVLYRLYSLTHNSSHAECARHFDKPAFLQPLLEGRDPLPGLHAITHLAQVQGFAARYEHVGDPQGMDATAQFFALALEHHTFSTGGNNWFEHWGHEDSLGDALNDTHAAGNTQESCTTYNMLKIARTLFRYTGDAALADYYERAMLNGVIGIQRMPRQPPTHAHTQLPHGSEHAQHPHVHAHTHVQHGQEHTRHPHLHAHTHSHPHLHLPSEGASRGSHAAAASAAAASATASSAAASLIAAPSAAASAAREAAASLASPAGEPGVFIYYLPLGAGQDKGTELAWTHWGTAFDSFWCCYGTAIESFSKLADSIYFHTPPPGPSPDTAAASAGAATTTTAAIGTATGSGSPGAGSALGGASAGSEGGLPVLYVNQLVSSSLRWRDLRVVLHQQSELYGPDNAAVSRLSLDIYPPDAALDFGSGPTASQADASAAAGGPQRRVSGAEQRRFVLKWRIPGWARASGVQITVNGKNRTATCAEGPPAGPAAGEAGAGGQAQAGGPPQFESGARFCSLGYTWTNGDVVDVVMPMRVVAEDLRDGRPEMQALKAVMMGPFLMAGLTHGERDLAADPDNLEDALSLPDPSALVSLAAAAAAPADTAAQGSAAEGELAPLQQLLRHCEGGVQLGGKCGASGSAAALDATFQMVAPLAGCQEGSDDDLACSPARTRQLLMQQAYRDGTAGEGAALHAEDGAALHAEPRLVSFEAASAPGHFLSAEASSGRLVLRQAGGRRGAFSSPSPSLAAQTFRLRPVQQPVRQQPVGGTGGQQAFVLEPLSQPGSLVQMESVGKGLSVQKAGAPGAAPTAFLVSPAAATYPPGARVLHGTNRDYIVAPLGQLMDEPYTAYFNFLPLGPQKDEGEQLAAM